jgi:hypothetical protein
MIRKESYEREQLEIRSDIKTLAEMVKQGFEHMDKRFEAVNKRFEDIFTSLRGITYYQQIKAAYSKILLLMYLK